MNTGFVVQANIFFFPCATPSLQNFEKHNVVCIEIRNMEMDESVSRIVVHEKVFL